MANEAARKAVHGGAMLGVAQFGLAFAGYLVAIVLGRSLGPEQYGTYGIIYSLLLGIELIGRLGVPQAVSRLIAGGRQPAQELVQTGLAATLVVSLVLFAAFWLGAPQLAAVFGLSDGTRLLRIAALDIPIHLLYIAGVHVVNGHRRFAQEAAATVVYATARALGVLLLLLVGVSVEAALVANIAASIVGFVYVASRLPLASFLPSRRHLREILKVATPIALFSAGSQVLTRLDLWALGAVGDRAPAEKIGQYVAATSLGKLPNVLFFVLSSLLIPMVARALADGQRTVAARYVQESARFMIVFLLPAVMLCAVQAGDVMEFCFGVDYREGSELLQLLIVAYGLAYTVMMTLAAILIALDRASWSARLTLSAIVAGMALNFLLVPPYAATGAGWAALLTMGLTCAMAGVMVRRELGQPLVVGDVLIRALLASAAVAWVALELPTSGLALLLELGGLMFAYWGLLWLLGVVQATDVALLRPGAGRGTNA
jgi:O-antigen/teichoic acid export membrane protein